MWETIIIIIITIWGTEVPSTKFGLINGRLISEYWVQVWGNTVLVSITSPPLRPMIYQPGTQALDRYPNEFQFLSLSP